jgi:hypothetical protein
MAIAIDELPNQENISKRFPNAISDYKIL